MNIDNFFAALRPEAPKGVEPAAGFTIPRFRGFRNIKAVLRTGFGAHMIAPGIGRFDEAGMAGDCRFRAMGGEDIPQHAPRNPGTAVRIRCIADVCCAI